MPSLGADMQEATLVKWRIKPGDSIKKGQLIGEVDTAKGIIDLECFQEGFVDRLIAKEGEIVAVGAVIMLLKNESELATASAMEPSRKSPADAEQIPKKSTVQLQENQIINQEMSPNSAVARIKVSPLARRRAEELGIDLLTIKTAHADGIISLEDIEQAAKGVTEKSKNEQLENSRQALRGAIAAAMSKSKREIPHYYLQTSIDMSRTIAWLEKENSQRTIVDRLLPVVVLLKAVAKALKKVPQLNGYWVDGKIQVLEEIHIGFAISMTGGGLVAPAMHHVDSKDLDQLMSDLRELIPRARSGRLRSSELTDATVTITSLGDLGVESVTGIIYPPQVALIGLGKILSRPWVDSGVVCVKPVMIASLSADHRATDGLLGAKFLDTLATILQEPQTL